MLKFIDYILYKLFIILFTVTHEHLVGPFFFDPFILNTKCDLNVLLSKLSDK